MSAMPTYLSELQKLDALTAEIWNLGVAIRTEATYDDRDDFKIQALNDRLAECVEGLRLHMLDLD